MGPENFALFRPTAQKLQHLWTDTQTDRQKQITSVPLHKFFFGIYVRGKEGNSTNRVKFLPPHFVKENTTILTLDFCEGLFTNKKHVKV